jgi:hypothetical protein
VWQKNTFTLLKKVWQKTLLKKVWQNFYTFKTSVTKPLHFYTIVIYIFSQLNHRLHTV